MALKMANIVRKIISTAHAPQPIGPYSQAVLVDKTLYVSGQIGLDPQTGGLVSGGVGPETKQALENMGKILEAAGTNYSNVVKCTILMTKMEYFQSINNVYKEYFPQKFPARAAYQVVGLPAGAQVEIEAIAVVGDITDTSSHL